MFVDRRGKGDERRRKERKGQGKVHSEKGCTPLSLQRAHRTAAAIVDGDDRKNSLGSARERLPHLLIKRVKNQEEWVGREWGSEWGVGTLTPSLLKREAYVYLYIHMHICRYTYRIYYKEIRTEKNAPPANPPLSYCCCLLLTTSKPPLSEDPPAICRKHLTQLGTYIR